MTHLNRTIDDFDILGLQSDRAEVWVAPALGGKWVSLRDRRTGREWMWSPRADTRAGTPAGKGLFRAPDAHAFHTSSLVGADECIPTIAPSSWQGRALPDHGEVWNIPWAVVDTDHQDDPANSLTLAVDMPISPLRLKRRLHLEDATVEVRYRLENRGDTLEPFVWAFHPLLWIVPGDRLALGPGVNDLLLESAIGLALGGRGDVCAWPAPQPDIDLAALELGDRPAAAKFFTRPLSAPEDGWAKVFNPGDNTSLTYTFDTEEINTLGIWLTRGGWNGYHHLAVEPGIGAPDPLDVAVNS